MKIDILISIIIQGAIALGPFAALLLAKRKPRQPFLIAITLCLSVTVSHSYYISGIIGHFIESPFIIAEPFIFLISPLLYFYFSNISDNKVKLTWIDLKHIIPFAFFFASFIPISLHGKNSVYYSFLYSNKIVMTGFLWIILVSQFLYYYSKIYKLNKIYSARLQQYHSNYMQYDASWVRIFLLLFLTILAFVSVVLFVFLHESNVANFSTIVALFFSAQLYFIAYKGLNQKTIIIENELASETRSTEITNSKGELDNVHSAACEKLEVYMNREKPFLNPELTLIDLANQVGMTRNELSALINNVIGSNFYLFVNEFRVAHVKQLIQNDSQNQFTILAHAFDSGFNSKSTFNALFKKITGLTPSEYRKTLN